MTPTVRTTTSRRRSASWISTGLAAGLLALPASTLPANALPALTPAAVNPHGSSTTSAASTSAAASKHTVTGPRTVYRGKKVTFLGTAVTDGSPRAVTLRVWKSKSRTWKVIARTSTDAAGALRISTVAPKSSTSRRYRVTVPAVRSLPARTHPFSVNVVKAPGSPAQWNTPFPADFTATWTPARTPVGADATFTVTGVVPGPTGRNRTVVVQRKHTDTWKTVARATTDAGGAYTLRAPGDWLVDLQHRVYVPAAQGARKRFSQATRLKSTPTWKLTGRTNDWTYLRTDDGLRQRWNPCSTTPINYRVNLRLAPEFVTVEMVQQAVRETAQATGLRFAYAGATTRHAFPKAGRPWPEGTDMVISWTRNGQSSERWPNSQVQGLGGISSYQGTDARGDVGIASMGHVMLQAGSGFLEASPENTYGVLKHELGHAVGLNHSRTGWGDQLMDAYYFPERSTDWGRGDLRGLRQVGATSGCTQGINWWGTSSSTTGDDGSAFDQPELTTTVRP